MILAIDMGNTHTEIGLLDGEKTVFSSRVATDLNKTSSEYAVMMHALFEIHDVDITKIEGAIISSVVPPLTYEIRDAVKFAAKVTPLIVGPGIRTGLKIRIEDPKALGADLVVDAVAANELYGYPNIVIDMGTATTIMVDNDKGEFIGGVIVPGVGISLNALGTNASKLPKINLTAPAKVINGQTVEAMQSGTVYGQAGLLDGIIRRMTRELGYPCKVVATGGLAKLIVPYCETEIVLDNDLMLKGLRLIYEKNKAE